MVHSSVSSLTARNTSDSQSITVDSSALPFIATLDATTLGGTEGSVSIAHIATGSVASFQADFSLALTDALDSRVSAFESVRFTVTEASLFSASGFLSLSGNARMALAVELRDFTLGGGIEGIIYRSVQISELSQNGLFVVGGQAGTTANNFRGQLPGVLLPGHDYEAFWAIDVQNGYASDQVGATAFGSLDFNITPGVPVAVPEPTAIALWSIGAISMGFVARRKKMLTVRT